MKKEDGMTYEEAMGVAENLCKYGLVRSCSWETYAQALIAIYEHTCKPENSPVDERKTDKGIIGRIEELERQIGCINARLENHGRWLGDLQGRCRGLKERMDNNAVWHKDVDVAQEDLEKRIDELEKWRRG